MAKLDPANKKQYMEEAGNITQDMASGPAIRRVHFLKQALQFYQDAGADEKIKNCRKAIDEAEHHIPEEMQLFQTGPIDISQEIKKIKEIIDHSENVKQAIIRFADMVRIDKREDLFDSIKSGNPLLNLCSSIRVDHMGRQINALPTLPFGKQLSMQDDNVQSHMWDKAREMQSLTAGLFLKCAYAELNNHYIYTEEDLDFLVKNNAIIPKGREIIIRKGLFLGLQNDLYTSLHILVPQMENIIRHLVILCDGTPYFIEPDGSMKVRTIGSLLDSKELNDCYDPDILFCLKGLLDKREGSNLRNDIAHGILEPAQGNSTIGLYFLGLMIRIISWYSIDCLDERQIMNKQ